jgi:hypothetical protein
MLLIICDFHENRLRGGGNGNCIDTCAVKPRDLSKVKNALVQLVCCVTKCAVCNFVAWVCRRQKAVCVDLLAQGLLTGNLLTKPSRQEEQ